MAYEIVRFPYDGAIDADGHILEPADLWESYLEDRFKPRALRIRADDEGLEYLEIDGTKSARTPSGALAMMGAMGDPDAKLSAERTYAANIPFGASDPRERLELLEQENLDKALLYPSIGRLAPGTNVVLRSGGESDACQSTSAEPPPSASSAASACSTIARVPRSGVDSASRSPMSSRNTVTAASSDA